MTAELGLAGEVGEVGGIKKKVESTEREGFEELILPKANKSSYQKLSSKRKFGGTVHFVKSFDEVAQIVFGRTLIY